MNIVAGQNCPKDLSLFASNDNTNWTKINNWSDISKNDYYNEINEDDILCFKNAGAYCYSMASNYNSRYRPAEVLIYEGQAHLIRERERFEDLIKHQVEVDFETIKPLETVNVS